MEDFNGMVLPERSLHLFAGAGGGILGDLLLGREVVGAVECEKYQREVLFQRQADGILPRFPVWDDVTTFRLDNGETESYIRWLQEIRDDLTVCGGFPCQDVSVANKNAKGLDGERSGLWTEMLRIIGEIRPRCVFVENSPALIVRGFDRVLGDLTQIGYDCRWAVIGADDVGAPHQRKRFWLLGQKGGGIPTPIAHDAKGCLKEESLIRKDGKGLRLYQLPNYVFYVMEGGWRTPTKSDTGGGKAWKP